VLWNAKRKKIKIIAIAPIPAVAKECAAIVLPTIAEWGNFPPVISPMILNLDMIARWITSLEFIKRGEFAGIEEFDSKLLFFVNPGIR
jgi:hypothetical protein